MRWNIGEGWVGIFPAVSPLLVWNCSFYPPNVAASVWQLLMEWWRTEQQLPHPHCEKIQFTTLRVRLFQDSSLHFRAKLNFFHFVIAINPQLHWRMEWFWDANNNWWMFILVTGISLSLKTNLTTHCTAIHAGDMSSINELNTPPDWRAVVWGKWRHTVDSVCRCTVDSVDTIDSPDTWLHVYLGWTPA